jgi:hypothetical protein
LIRSKAFHAACALLLLQACTHGSAASETAQTQKGVPLSPNVTCATPGCAAYNVRPYVRISTHYGVGCLGNVPPGTTPNPIPPPMSYAATDLGKRDVPEPTLRETAILRRIAQQLRSSTLRFAWVDGANQRREFIVYDAPDGPCALDHYEVLNGSCNRYYMPGENPYHEFGGTAGNWPCKRPWGFASGDERF